MNVNKKDFDKEAANWDETPGRVKLAHDIARAMMDIDIIKSDMNVLDFGCGTGLLTLQLQPLVRLITGVDSSAGMLEVLQQKIESQKLTNVKTQLLNIEEGDSLEGTYDLIVSSMTLHHIKDIKGLFNHFKLVTNTNGYLCLADLDPDEGQFHQDNEGVFHFGFDRGSLRQILEEAGFDVVEIKTATEMMKAVPGGTRAFSIFLITGHRRTTAPTGMPSAI
jgi:2-polyprenyl-3-methyl-5-hydroxy-6-metoxy-1,4-benzoquinol methylase